MTNRLHGKRDDPGWGILGERLKAERKRRKLRLQDLCEMANVDMCQLTGYENRGVYPTLKNAIRLAQALECSIDWLVGIEA